MCPSFFRPGNETSTDDSGSDLSDASNPIELASSPRQERFIRTSSTPIINLPQSSSHPRSLPRPVDGPRTIPHINTLHLDPLASENANYQRDILLHTLLEDRCVSEAIEQLNNRPGHQSLYTKDHPDVKALAEEKYKFMSVHLGSVGLISAGTPDDQLQPLRQTFREGLDFLSVKGNGKKGPLIRNSASAVSITDSMNTLLTPPTISPAYQAGFLEMQRAVIAREMPTYLLPLINHPLLSTTRYAREFEDCGLLGRGGFGKVYMVSHKLDYKHYAIKRIELGANRMRNIELRGTKELDGLLQEARVLAQLDHPNIVRYYSCWLECLPKDPPNHSSIIGKHAKVDSPSAEYSSECKEYYHHTNVPTFHLKRSKASREDDLWDAGAGIQINFEHSDSAYQDENSDKDEPTSDGDDNHDHDECEEEEEEDDGDDLASLPSSFRKIRRRRQSNATVLSFSSKQSTSLDDDEVEIVQRTDTNDRQLQMISRPRPSQYYTYETSSHDEGASQSNLTLTLHIQMSYHPLTLAEYMSISTQPASLPVDGIRFGQNFRHCFHVQTSLKILMSILDGLEYLHSHKLVHRDLKPANIFLSFCQGYDVSAQSNTHPSANDFLYSAGGVDITACQKCQSCGTGAYSRPLPSAGPILMNARIGDFGLVNDLAQPANYALKHVGTEIYRPPPPATVYSRNRTTSLPLKLIDSNRAPISHGTEIKISKPGDSEAALVSGSQKVDVYSLGIILFELLYPTFTRMERQEKISELKTQGKFPSGFACPLTSATDLNSDPCEKDTELSREIKKCILLMVERDESRRASCPEVRTMVKTMLTLISSST